MTAEQDVLRDWHRLFGLLLTDYFTGLPFTVEVERDLSQQQQLLDVVIIRRRQGAVSIRLPDGLEDLADHNLITFKSHHETLDSWAIKELIGHYVAYRKLVSPTTSELLAEDRFRLYAVCARFPDKLSTQSPWREQQPGVYHCLWGTDEVRVIVARKLSREAHNAPLHLFSASPELVGFGQTTYHQRSVRTSRLLGELFEHLQGEGVTMYTMDDFIRDQNIKDFNNMSPEDQEKFLHSLPPEKLLAAVSADQIRRYLDKLSTSRRPSPRKPRRKK